MVVALPCEPLSSTVCLCNKKKSGCDSPAPAAVALLCRPVRLWECKVDANPD